METAIQFAQILLPAALVLYAMFLTVRAFLRNDFEKKLSDLRMKQVEAVMPIRLQAYERVTLLLERISPANLLVRLSGVTNSAHGLHQLLLENIREEFNHNLSQQLYMSQEVWQAASSAKEETIMLINGAASELPPEAPAQDLAKRIMEKAAERDVDSVQHAIIQVKAEIQQIF